ncbi:MAG: hypothetical protein QGH69_05395 [Alphaproteobacteria bacterium]|nr:hypothetical protein [Alphaproteobacteria bacterium]
MDTTENTTGDMNDKTTLRHLGDTFMGAAKMTLGGPLTIMFGIAAACAHMTTTGLAMNGFDIDAAVDNGTTDGGEILRHGYDITKSGASQMSGGIQGLAKPLMNAMG